MPGGCQLVGRRLDGVVVEVGDRDRGAGVGECLGGGEADAGAGAGDRYHAAGELGGSGNVITGFEHGGCHRCFCS